MRLWEPSPLEPGWVAGVRALRPIPNTIRLLMAVEWFPSSSGTSTSWGEVLEIETRDDTLRIAARLPVPLKSHRMALLVDGEDVLLADTQGVGEKAWHLRRSEGRLELGQELKWSGMGTLEAAWIGGALWRGDNLGGLYRHDSLSTGESTLLPLNYRRGLKLHDHGGRPAWLTEADLMVVVDDDNAVAEPELDATQYVQATRTNLGAWLLTIGNGLRVIPTSETITSATVPTKVGRAGVSHILGVGDLLFTIRSDRVQVEQDRGAGRLGRTSFLPLEMRVDSKGLRAADEDTVLFRDSSYATRLQRRLLMHDRPATEDLELPVGDSFAGGLVRGDDVWVVTRGTTASHVIHFDLSSKDLDQTRSRPLPLMLGGASAFWNERALFGLGSRATLIEFTDPRAIVELDAIDLPDLIVAIAAGGTTAWLASVGLNRAAVTALDITNPQQLVERGSTAITGGPHEPVLVADAEGAWLIDRNRALRRYELAPAPNVMPKEGDGIRAFLPWAGRVAELRSNEPAPGVAR